MQIGFVSVYSMMNAKEDFAEAFMHYVYRPSILWDKVARQSSNGSQTLSMKAALIAELYVGGVPGGWPGYRL